MADGQITFNTALDNKGLERDLAKQRRIIEQSTKKIESLELKKGTLTREVDAMGESLERSGNEIVRINQEIAERKAMGLSASQEQLAALREEEANNNKLLAGIEARESKLEDINRAQELENGHIATATERAGELAEKLHEVNRVQEQGNQDLETANEETEEIAENLNNVEKNTQKGSNAMKAFVKRVEGLAKRVFIFSVITKAFRSFKNYVKESASKNVEFSNSLAQMKGAWQVAFQPIVDFVVPYLIKLLQFLTKVGYAIAAIFAKFTGRSLSDLKASTKAANENAKAVNNQVKAYRQLAGFDEMDVLQDNSSSSSGGAAVEETPSATFDFDTTEIESKLAEIEAIAGAATLALGLILTLFGHWVIGIPLLAAGAAMLIDAANTEGSSLNTWIQEHLEEVTSGLIIAGAVAMALGLILAFSGNLPLGIALIGLGAAALYEAAELNGGVDKFIEENQSQIAAILMAAGAALLVLGAILAFSGNLPLGIGLMLAGAAAIYGSVKLDSNVIKRFIEENKSTITAILTIGGAALIVVGAILAFTGVMLPLAIGMITAGAGMLFGAVSLNWDTIQKYIEENKEQIGKIMTIGGLALVVLGLVLALTGVALPLGIGLVAAGAAMLFSAVALNWDTVKDKIQNVVATIMAIAAGSLVALGILLCLSGAGIGLGIALLLAGLSLEYAALQWSAEDNPIVNAVKNVCNGVLGFVEGLINKIIAGLNWMVDMINKISFEVPDWVPLIGGKRVGFNLKHVSEVQLPRLAQGAVIPANREFLAVLGDQKSGTNIETPLDTMIEAFKTALADYSGGDVTIPIYLDGKQIARQVININNRREFAMNGG